MNNFLQRLTTGVIFITVVLVAVYLNQYTFLALFLGVIFLCLLEYHTIITLKLGGVKSWKRVSKYLNIFFGLSVFIMSFLISIDILPYSVFTVIILYPLIWFIIELFGNSERPFANVAYNALGIYYIALPLASACIITFKEGYYDPIILIAIFIFVWANDSWAYVFGSLFGKHKLMERVSPKKTWEGTIGGMIGTLGFGWLAYYLTTLFEFSNLTLENWMIIAGICVIMSTLGDLAESMMKRNLQVKDTGQLLPGHGGFLDRFDAFLFSLPICAVYVSTFGL